MTGTLLEQSVDVLLGRPRPLDDLCVREVVRAWCRWRSDAQRRSGRRSPNSESRFAPASTGECELIGDDIGGLAVHIGARLSALARGEEILVSGTVKDIVVGSGVELAERGVHALKGVPGEWRVFAA